MKKFFLTFVLLLAFTSLNAGLIVEKDKPAPGFSLFPLKGKRINLSTYKGNKAVLINIFSTTCEPCKEELPFLVKFYEQYKNNIEFVGITVTDTKKPEVEEFVKKFNITFPVCMDYSKSFYKLYIKGDFNMPTTLFVNKEGIIVDIQGPLKEKQLKLILEEVAK
ncbi:MAG: TlpA disulfide reductase family protein [Candidatus Firestonebacteria bacterium]